MNKTLIKLLVVAGVAVSGVATANTSPAETAGLCAANALIIKKTADAAGIPKLSALAQAQIARNYQAYGTQPGFKQAAEWQLKQTQTTADQRLKIADGCASQGF